MLQEQQQHLQAMLVLAQQSRQLRLAVGANAFTVNSSGTITATTGITTSGSYTQSGNGANTLTGTTAFNATGTAATFIGNVGIGTTTPAGGLAVMNGNVGIGTWVSGREIGC